MDYYERLLFNVRLGTQDKDGMLMYYVPLKPGAGRRLVRRRVVLVLHRDGCRGVRQGERLDLLPR